MDIRDCIECGEYKYIEENGRCSSCLNSDKEYDEDNNKSSDKDVDEKVEVVTRYVQCGMDSCSGCPHKITQKIKRTDDGEVKTVEPYL
jgi:hypothetical protein